MVYLTRIWALSFIAWVYKCTSFITACLAMFCQSREITRSISVAESFDGYCCLSVCLSERTSLSLLKHLQMRGCIYPYESVSDLLDCSWGHIILRSLGFGWSISFPPSPQLCDRSVSNMFVCLLFPLLLFQMRPKYTTWTCKCQVICTWQITGSARDGLEGWSVNFAVHEVWHWGSTCNGPVPAVPAQQGTVYCLCI